MERYRLGAVRVRLAHARCASSQVVEVDAEIPDVAGFGGMLSKSAVLQYATDPRVRPLLILEPKIELSEATAGGEQVNLQYSLSAAPVRTVPGSQVARPSAFSARTRPPPSSPARAAWLSSRRRSKVVISSPE